MRDQKAAIQFLDQLDGTKHPVTNRRLSELFTWKIVSDFLAPTGVMGILLSTRSFVARTAKKFPNALAHKVRILGLANFAHFRYRLFKGSRNPGIAIFARLKDSNPLDQMWVYSPMLTSQAIGQRGHLWSIVVSDIDVEHHRLQDLTKTNDGWFCALMLRPIDRWFANYLRLWTSKHDLTLGDFLIRSGFHLGRGGSPIQTGVSPDLLLGSNDYRDKLGLDNPKRHRYPHNRIEWGELIGSFQKVFAGNIVLIPRHMNQSIYVQKPIAFNSSFNAIYSTRRSVDHSSLQSLRCLASFLNSDVARYLYALFGRTWILDRARVEKRDLAKIPFPFCHPEDRILLKESEFDQRQITQRFAERTGLGDFFVSEVNEYIQFRQGYEDAQIPGSALNAPEIECLSRYQYWLVYHLNRYFGPKANVQYRLRSCEPNSQFEMIHIQIGSPLTEAYPRDWDNDSNRWSSADPTGGEFSPYTHVTFDANTSCARLISLGLK